MRRLNLHNIICIQSVFNNIQSFLLVFIIHIFSALLVNKIFYGLCFLTKNFFGVKMINSVSAADFLIFKTNKIPLRHESGAIFWRQRGVVRSDEMSASL